MQSVLAMVIICGLLLGAGAGATYEVHKWAKRVDTGQVIQAPGTTEVPDTNAPCVDLKLISYSFVWIAVPMNPQDAEIVSRPIHPVLIIKFNIDGLVTLGLTNDASWQTVAFSDLVPCDNEGVPLDWNYSSGDIPAGVPVDVLRSSNLVDWDYIATAQAPGQYRDVDADMRQGQNFYQVIQP